MRDKGILQVNVVVGWARAFLRSGFVAGLLLSCAVGVADAKPLVEVSKRPGAVSPGKLVVVTGRVPKAEATRRAARVVLETGVVKKGKRLAWTTRSRSGVKARGTFALRWRAPSKLGRLSMRVRVVRGGKTVAVSRRWTMKVARQPSVGSPGAPVGSPLAPGGVGPLLPGPSGQPPSTPSPATPDLRITAAPMSLTAGSEAIAQGLSPLTVVSRVSAVTGGGAGDVTARELDGALAIAARSQADPGDVPLTVTGVGCTSTACDRPFAATIPVEVNPVRTVTGAAQGFSEASPDRVLGATDHELADELLVTVGSPGQPGDQAQAEHAAAQAGGVVTGGVSGAGVFEVRWATPQDLGARARQLEAQPNVTAVNASTVGLYGPLASVPVANAYSGDEWTWPYLQVRAPEAWGSSVGSRTKVAIIDNGKVHPHHEDLDVVRSMGASGLTHHATHVAGLACAKANGVGMVGLAHGCPIVSADGLGLTRSNKTVFAAMYDVAAVSGARVANVSLGGEVDFDRANQCYTSSEAARATARHARDKDLFRGLLSGAGRHVLWTFAAGNSCAPGAASPWAMNSDLDNVVTVAAANANGKLASFSNFGPGVEIAAPGGVSDRRPTDGLMSTTLATGTATCLPDQACRFYRPAYGTSMAAPVVAGIGALAIDADPQRSAQEIGKCIADTAGSGGTGSVTLRDTLPAVSGEPIAFSGQNLPIANAEAAVDCAKQLASPVATFALSDPKASPAGMTAGPDGAMWFTTFESGTIGRITTTGKITEYPLPNRASGPASIVAGPDGALWFTENLTGAIGRITTNGAITEFPLPVRTGRPYDLTVGPDGNIWFTEIFGNRIGRITPSGSIATYPLPGSGRGPAGIVAGGDGSVWFTENHAGAVGIGKVTADGTITEYPTPSSWRPLQFMSADSDGTVWLAARNGVGKVNPSGTVDLIDTPGVYPIGLAAGSDGALWTTQPEWAEHAVNRVTRSGAVKGFALPKTEATTQGVGRIAEGPDGAMWFTEPRRGVIGRVPMDG